jgi:hypothetical protein
MLPASSVRNATPLPASWKIYNPLLMRTRGHPNGELFLDRMVSPTRLPRLYRKMRWKSRQSFVAYTRNVIALPGSKAYLGWNNSPFSLTSRFDDFGIICDMQESLPHLQVSPETIAFVRFARSELTVSTTANVALPATAETTSSLYDSYRDSTDIKRLKSVNLDRKLSATARMPQRSTIVESPSGKTARGDGSLESQKSIDGQLHSLSANSPAGNKEEGPPISATPSGASHEIVIVQPADEDANANTPSRVDILRPAFGRANTHVAIVSDNSNENSPGASTPQLLSRSETESSPFEHEQGVTLADIPALVEAEQAKLEHRPPPVSEGRPLMSELSALDATIVKHFALIALTKSSIAHYIDMEELFELVEIRKNQWWNKIFKPGK